MERGRVKEKGAGLTHRGEKISMQSMTAMMPEPRDNLGKKLSHTGGRSIGMR